jgi:hypothetical protein
VHNRKLKSALVVAGVAAGAAAAASWFGKKKGPGVRAVGGTDREALGEANRSGLSSARYSEIRDLSPVDTSRESMIEPESAELPIGRSADPDIDWTLSRSRLPQDETTGAALFGEAEPERRPHRSDLDLALDDIWSSTPGIAEPEQSEGYDAVLPEDLGAVWIERATQTTHEHRPHASDPSDVPELEELVSQSTYAASHSRDDGDAFRPDDDNEDNEDIITDDELDDDDQDPTEKYRSDR